MTATSPSKETILVADDEASIRRILETRLSMIGYQVVTACDGNEALDLFRNCEPDLVVLDVMMPKLDGYGVCQELRKESDVPIVMLTALGDVADRITGLELGADDYVVKPKREVTIRDLLTHTSGLTYSSAGEGPVHQMYRKFNIRPYFFGALDSEISKFPGDTCQFAALAASAPLLHNPGEKWSYGINMDVLGCVVEVITGMSFADYLEKNIFKPLNMNSTGFSVKPSEKDSFTTLYTSGMYRRDGEPVGQIGANYADVEFSKSLRSIDPFNKSPYLKDSSTLYDGGSGLVSSIDDYSLFSEMLLNNGELNGVRILSKASVELMSRNHLDLDRSEAVSFGVSGLGFGLTVGVVEDAGQAGVYGSDGEFFWGGAASTTFWIDQEKNITAVLMTQYMPSNKYPLREELRALLYSGISN